MKDGDVQMITYMPRDLRRRLKHLATARDTNMTAIVREAVEKIVQEAKAASGEVR